MPSSASSWQPSTSCARHTSPYDLAASFHLWQRASLDELREAEAARWEGHEAALRAERETSALLRAELAAREAAAAAHEREAARQARS